MKQTMETKTKTKTPVKRTKKTAEESAMPSILAAMAPALFVEEEVQEHIPSPPTPSKKTKKSTTSRKPPVIASVTPDGIQGTLTNHSDQRPLIAHLPIHSADIESDMFANDDPETPAVVIPSPYNPDESYARFDYNGTISTPEQITIPTRPTLPLNHSEKLMVRFQDANRDQELPESTDIACYWDCHTFRGRPCVIPITIEEGVWKCRGNFCSPQCAAAHLFKEACDLHVKWESYALLNRLYSPDGEPIRLAPSPTVTRLFGGPLEIEDYRKIVGEGRIRIDVTTPPIISIIQVMDTKPIGFYDESIKNTMIPWQMDRMNRPGAQGLRLQRKNPAVREEATIEWCMGIKAK
jgi:hypothetical protein